MPIPPALLALIDAQDGAVSSVQALACGLTPKALRSIASEWTTLSPGLHIVGEVTWLGFARAALLRGGDDAALGERERSPGRKLVEESCAAAADGVESVLEWLFQQQLLIPHRFPTPSRQVRSPQGHRVDAWFEGAGVLVELDGRAFHDADVDAARDNQHAMQLGVLTLRFTWRQVVREPCSVARVIVEALRARGWSGSAQACPQC